MVSEKSNVSWRKSNVCTVLLILRTRAKASKILELAKFANYEPGNTVDSRYNENVARAYLGRVGVAIGKYGWPFVLPKTKSLVYYINHGSEF